MPFDGLLSYGQSGHMLYFYINLETTGQQPWQTCEIIDKATDDMFKANIIKNKCLSGSKSG